MSNENKPTLIDTLINRVNDLNNELIDLKRKKYNRCHIPVTEVSLFIVCLYWFFILIDSNLYMPSNVEIINIFEHIMSRYIWAAIFMINMFLLGYSITVNKVFIHKVSLFYSFVLMASIASIFYIFSNEYSMFTVIYYIFSIQAYVQMKIVGDKQ